jgi:hypothetical protein
MKKTHRRLLVVAIGLALVAGFILPPIPKAKRHGTRIQAVNSMSSFSFSISTNAFASRQTKTP